MWSGRELLSQGKGLQVAGKGTRTSPVRTAWRTDGWSAGCQEELGADHGARASFLGGLGT